MLRKIIFMALTLFSISMALCYADESVQLPQTGQEGCYNSEGAEILCIDTGQDGNLRAGVAWPSPRFAISGDCAMIDNLTGLMWIKTPELPINNWDSAISSIHNSTLCGHSDWRLPNINELESLINADEPNIAEWLKTQGFSNVKESFYWSSTTHANDTNKKWGVFMSVGRVQSYEHDYAYGYLWPVRDAQSEGVVSLPQTGQKTFYATYDDGYLEKGVTWPIPRFNDHGNGTVTDDLTGLMWTKDANVPGPSECNPGIYKTWQGVLDYIKCLNDNTYLGYNDWRLPNTKELRSLIDYSQYNPALPTGHPFTNVQSNTYWSSTTYVLSKDFAWSLDMMDGYVGDSGKGIDYPGWPVRTGQSGNLDVSPSSHDFGEQLLGQDYLQLFTLNNTGAINILIGIINIKGIDTSEFSIQDDNCSDHTLAPLSNCTFQVVFSPSSTGTISATLSIPSNDPDALTLSVSLRGIGLNPKISIGPSSVNFGNVAVGITSRPKTVTIRNTGVSDLIISSIDITGTNASEFSQTSDCNTIPAKGSCTINVTLIPALPFEKKTATMEITSNDPNPKREKVFVKLSGESSPPKISVSPSSVNGGKVKVGEPSALKTVTVKNTGVSDLIISSITIAGTNASEFTQTSDCTTIPAKSTCTINVTMTPALPFEKKSATMDIASNDPKKPTVTVKLSGESSPPKISSSPSSINFKNVSVGSTSDPKVVTIKNRGISDLEIASITINGTNTDEFSKINTCTTIPKGSSCDVTAAFSPTSAGSKRATLDISTNDPKKPIYTVKLSGKGI